MVNRLLVACRASIAGVALAAAQACAQDVFQGESEQWRVDDGRNVRLDQLYGEPTVITMAYGSCRRVCSSSLRMMERLQAIADARHVTLKFVVVGLDPNVDRPADWAAYRQEHGLARANWFFIAGSEAATRRLASRLGIRYWRYGEHIVHNLRIILLSKDAMPLRSIDAVDADLEALLP